MEHSFKGARTGNTVSGQFGLSSSQRALEPSRYFLQTAVNKHIDRRNQTRSSYGEQWNRIWLNIMKSYNFSIVDLWGIRRDADLFVHLCSISRTLLNESLLENIEPVISAEHVFSTWTIEHWKNYLAFRFIRSPMQDEKLVIAQFIYFQQRKTVKWHFDGCISAGSFVEILLYISWKNTYRSKIWHFHFHKISIRVTKWASYQLKTLV